MRPKTLIALAALMAATLATTAAAADDTERTHALLLNGGGNAKVNYLSHFHHLQDMRKVLLERGVPADQITVFSSDGEDRKKDLRTKAVTSRPKDFWLVGSTNPGRGLSTSSKIENTEWDGVKLHPARHEALRTWFMDQHKVLGEGDTLLIFVTDHGKRGKDDLDNGSIVLWDEEMTVYEMRALLGHLAPEVRVVMLMSQCFSGTFDSAIYPLGEDTPESDTCGFFSTRNDRFAYGCYPEGRGRDQIGHAFQFIGAMREYASLDDAHSSIAVSDDTPDVPLRSSDFFLARRLQAEAEARNDSLEAVADELLEIAWRTPSDYATQTDLIDQMAVAYGLFSPRTMAEVTREQAVVDALFKAAEDADKMWEDSFDRLREANLERFFQEPAGARWGRRLESSSLRRLKEPQKQKVAEELIPALVAFTKKSGDTWPRLKTLRSKRASTSKLHYRLEIRQAVLIRMRHLLIRVAGEVLLARPAMSMTDGGREKSREALANLEKCEDWGPGAIMKGGEAPKVKTMAPLSAERTLLGDNIPSRLGISYDLAPKEAGRPPGAIEVNRVQPDSPADRAGIAKGDIIHGAGGTSFIYKHHIRDWVMTATHAKPVQFLVEKPGTPASKIQIQLAPAIKDLPDIPEELGIGTMVPANGEPAVEPAIEGKRLLFFWSTSCSPCRKAMAEMMAWGKATGTPVLAITHERQGQLKIFQSYWGDAALPSHMVTDTARRSHRAFRVRSTPTLLLIDADNRIQYKKEGLTSGEPLGLPRG